MHDGYLVGVTGNRKGDLLVKHRPRVVFVRARCPIKR